MNKETDSQPIQERKILQMKTQIASMIKDVFQDEDCNEPESKVYDFNELNDSLFNDEAITNFSHTEYKRENPTKPSTMKANNTLLFKRMNDFQINQRQKRNFQTMNITHYPSINPNPFQHIMPNQHQIQGKLAMQNPMLIQGMPLLHQQYNHVMMTPSTVMQDESMMRNYYQKKTFNCQMPSTFNPNHNFIYRNIEQQKRFNTTQQIPIKNKIVKVELFMTEIEILLNKANCIDYFIHSNLKGNIVQLLKTQMGSRILQNYIYNTPSNIVHLIFEELGDKAGLLLLDPYANYFCLKLFSCLIPNDRLKYLGFISKSFVTLSLNKIATYPIQCIVGNLKTKNEKELIANPIKNNLMKLATDIYGTHVLEKAMICFEYDIIKDISSHILDNFVYLANNSNGLCVAKKLIFLEYKNLNFPRLMQIMLENSIQLIQNPYGNYAIQIAIDYWEQCNVDDLVLTFIDNCSQLSTEKYSSNVIERCIEKSELFLHQFINQTCKEKDTIGHLMKNSFGNYVIQTALKYSKGDCKSILIKAIEDHLDILGEKKLISKWKSILSSNYTPTPDK